MSRASHSGSFSASLAAMSALGMRTTLAVTSCICSSTGSGIARPSSTRPLHLPRHKVCTQTYFTPFRILAEPLFLFPHTAMTPFQQTIRYCWRTLPAVIWTALVAQEGASNANGEGPCRGSRPFCKLGHLAIQLGFANSIRSLNDTAFNLALCDSYVVTGPSYNTAAMSLDTPSFCTKSSSARVPEMAYSSSCRLAPNEPTISLRSKMPTTPT